MSSETQETARSLGDSINIATRSIHTTLNKLIIGRLPLAIPPEAQDPSNYVSGLLYITPIYIAFESSWRVILKLPTAKETDQVSDSHSCEACNSSSALHHTPNALDAPHKAAVCSRVQSLLEHVHTADLERTESLKRDIGSITGWSPEVLEQQLASASDSSFLSAFTEHIRQSVLDRPHVLLAYAWVLYMALFSGGRFIKASLSRLDPGFWTANLGAHASSKEIDDLPLNFFTFDGPDGGDEIKLSFKKRLAESELLLTNEERDDVVAEAKRIFEFMIEIVSELDGVCRTEPEVQQGQEEESIMWRMSRLLGLRTRDSVVVTKERKAWANFLKGQGENREED
ncbi:putative Heme oxygenase-like protein [Seiridium unicorne]|uniref:Heme oxygenase-like protein n=1 Tax=Seiridium unicorne TaxID=138068 RepID=A0ABR2V5E4_9PEZI